MNTQDSEFQEDTVLVACGDKSRLVPAVIHPKAPGLAVTMVKFGGFSVTHIHTGLAIFESCERSKKACLMLAEYARLAHICGFSWDDLATTEQAKETLKSCGDVELPSGEIVKKWVPRNRRIADEHPWESTTPLDEAVSILDSLPIASPSKGDAL